MEKAIAKRPIEVLKEKLSAKSTMETLGNALKDHKDAFVASIIDLWSGDKALQQCDANAIIHEALRAAVLRLPLTKSLGFSYIVVFNNSVKDEKGQWHKVPTPTFVMGYKGYIQLAMRTGQYKTINADVVYEGEIGKVDKLSGRISFDGEKKSDKVIGYFCYFELVNGFQKTLYMPVEDMAKYALNYSPSFKRAKKPTVEELVESANANKDSKAVGWEGNFNDMALKTVIRRLLSKYGYLSVEMQNAMQGEAESAEASRNDLIAENANTEVVDITKVDYEEVSDAPVEEPQPEY